MEIQSPEREDEGISKLPEPILHHILSFLSQKMAFQTCVLSKSWRYLGSTRPEFCLKESYFGKEKEKFMSVLEKSLQVYSDQKLSVEDFSVTMSKVNPELVSLLENWIPKVIHDIGVKKLHLSFVSKESSCFVLPSAVFESEPLQKLYLKRCDLSHININSISIGKHLKTLNLRHVTNIQDETFAKLMSSCPLIEDLSLKGCKGFTTTNMRNHHNLKTFDLNNVDGRSIEIYLPSTIGVLAIKSCPNWFHHRNYFPGVTYIKLEQVPLSDEWFNNFSLNFPCLEDLKLVNCDGFDELKLSSRSIKNLDIWMDQSTTKATIDTPSIKRFVYIAKISQSISFTTTSVEWKSKTHLYGFDFDDSRWFQKLSGLVAALSQSQIHLVLHHCGSGNNHFEHLYDISDKMPVAIESLELNLIRHFGDSFYSDLVNGLFRLFRPSKIKQNWFVDAQEDRQRKINKVAEFLCRTLQLGRLEEDEAMSFWQHDLQEVSLEVKNGHWEEWHPVQGTINWSEYVAALLPKKYKFYRLRFRLKWREFANSFD